MDKFRKIVSGLLTVTSAMTLSGLGLVSTTYGAQLTAASTTIDNTTPSATGTRHTVAFTIATSGNLKQVRLQYSNTASGSIGVPTGLGTTSATLDDLAVGGDTESDWGADVTTNGLVILTKTTGELTVTGTTSTFLVTMANVTNNSLSSSCDPVTGSESCFIRVTTFSDTGSTAVDTTTLTYTVVSNVTVTATVDPILTFAVAGMAEANVAVLLNGGDPNVGLGTTVTSTATSLPFGNVTVGTAKIAQQALTVQTNANNGYEVRGKFVTTGGSGSDVMIGSANSSNNIDKFNGGGTWTNPITWATPSGTAASVNSAWLGVRTNDYDVSSNFNSSDVWSMPLVATDSGVGNVVMRSTTPDNGTTDVNVSFKLQANAFQPADAYTGTWRYSVVPTY